MKSAGPFIVIGIVGLWPVGAQDLATRIRQIEARGEGLEARRVLARQVAANPRDVSALTAYAEFLDSHNEPGTRAAYDTLLSALEASGASQPKTEVLRRLLVLSLLANDQAAAARYLEQYGAVGAGKIQAAAPEQMPTVDVPGPLHSFARMAALSPDLQPQDLLPALARNIVTNGYQASSSNEALEQTEYLKLVFRYLSQARELEKLADADKHIRIDKCDSQKTADLLRVIGYRMRGACGGDLVLETVNATRAFLTIDSGFPLAELEQALRTNRLFEYDYSPTQIPAQYGPEYWLSSRERRSGEFIDVFLSDPSLCRLYLGMAKLDRETAEELRKVIPAPRLRAFAHVLDFFGGMLLIRNGKIAVPGGPRSAAAWADLVGVSPDQGASFVDRLISKDDGWLASYFDALSRIEGPALEYLTEPARMKRFYMALRGRITSPGPARPVFRSNTDLMLLTTRLRLEPNGQPHVPGSLEVWKNLFVYHPHGKYDGRLTKIATTWKAPDDVVEALFALCRKAVENEPLKIFMAISDVNRRRAEPLKPATVDRLARSYRAMGAQYAIFADVSSLRDETILLFLDTATAINAIRDPLLRADTAGTMQALVGLWQIFCRNEAIPAAKADATLEAVLRGFAKIPSARELFDAGQAGVRALLRATNTPERMSPQDRMLDLLAGTTKEVGSDAHQRMVQEMIRLFEAQRLISLKMLLDVADHVDAVAKGAAVDTALLNRLASRVAEIQLPRASLSAVEKNSLSYGYWTERHIESERKLDLRARVERLSRDPEGLRDVRGSLAQFLRDTLVGFNYLYYAPPGAQVLRTNPLFVRGHDFLGVQGANQTWKATEVLGTGWPSNAGGRLVGSVAGLAYALAEGEQNFMIPTREQALIWGDLVPQLILCAKVPRWWDVTPAQMHWVGLHLRLGETVLAEATLEEKLRGEVLGVLERQAAPARAHRVAEFLARGRLREASENVTPSELFALGANFAKQRANSSEFLPREIARLAAEMPDRVNYAAVSRAFGTPKPMLTNSYHPELLHLRTFPTLMGYSSRIMAESWESNTLYYAALADELGLPPSQLNVLIPEWTQQTVERIFATHLEDWPALLRSLRIVGDDVRAKARDQAAQQQASLRE